MKTFGQDQRELAVHRCEGDNYQGYYQAVLNGPVVQLELGTDGIQELLDTI